VAQTVSARLDDVAQRLTEVRAAIQAAVLGSGVSQAVLAAAEALEAQLEKLEMVTGELAGTARAAAMMVAGTYCRACGTAFPGRLESGDCPNCGTLGRLLPLHDAAEAARLARWSPRFKLERTEPEPVPGPDNAPLVLARRAG